MDVRSPPSGHGGCAGGSHGLLDLEAQELVLGR
jgi:hypothetical protein